MAALDDYAPFDSGIGANRTEDWWRKQFRHLTGSGVISGITNEFAVAQHSGGDQTVDVATGECFIRGHWGESTSTKNIALSAAHATLARIDRIVLRCDFSLNTISVEVLEGTPNATPTIPALTQDTTKWEIGLARIARAANDNSIGTADITDERAFLTFGGIEGLPVKRTVRVATTANGTLASAFEAGDTVDGVTLAYGDRILLKNQSTASENGIYVVNQTGAPTRATDADTSAKMRPNTLVAVSEGTANADKWFQLTTNAPIVLGTTNLTWAEFGAGSSAAIGDLVDYKFKLKTADETVTSSTTLQDDDHLAVALGASQTWEFEAMLACYDSASTVPDIKLAFTVPSGASVQWGAAGGAASIASDTGDGNWQGTNTSGTGIGFGLGGAGNRDVIHVRGVVKTSVTTGNLQLQFAQNTSSASGTVIFTNSYLVARRVA